MENGNLNAWVGNGFACLLTAIQTNEVFRIISLVLTCISVAVSIGYNVYKWYKDAKKDGKITKDELHKLDDVIKDGLDKAKDIVDKVKKDE